MCLKKISEEKVAKKDIYVYKLLLSAKIPSEVGIYRTPYIYFGVEIGSTYKSKISKYGDFISDGLYSYSSYNKEIRYKLKNMKYCVAECIIPKGSIYYTGITNTIDFNNLNSIVSDTLIYVQILDNNYLIRVIKKLIKNYVPRKNK